MPPLDLLTFQRIYFQIYTFWECLGDNWIYVPFYIEVGTKESVIGIEQPMALILE